MSNQEQPKPISWRKIAGTFLLRRQDGTEEKINSGQVFLARPEDIPLAFRDTIEPVDPAELVAKTNPPLEVTDPGYKIVTHSKVPGKFNVVDGLGKTMNEQALSSSDAAALLETLGSNLDG